MAFFSGHDDEDSDNEGYVANRRETQVYNLLRDKMRDLEREEQSPQRDRALKEIRSVFDKFDATNNNSYFATECLCYINLFAEDKFLSFLDADIKAFFDNDENRTSDMVCNGIKYYTFAKCYTFRHPLTLNPPHSKWEERREVSYKHFCEKLAEFFKDHKVVKFLQVPFELPLATVSPSINVVYMTTVFAEDIPEGKEIWSAGQIDTIEVKDKIDG